MVPMEALVPGKRGEGDREKAAAERRRKALRDVMRANGIDAATLARSAGLVSANALYNFLNGRADSLRQSTYERLAAAIPGATIATLVGERSSQRPALSHTIRIREEAAAGVWRSSPELPEDEQEGASIPEGALLAQGAFGVRLVGEDLDLDWPSGTLFVVVPFLMADVTDGCLVLLRRIRKRRVEVTLRQLHLDPESPDRAWLWPRSSRPEFQAPIACPWPLGGPFEHEGDRIEPTGVAIGAYVRLHGAKS